MADTVSWLIEVEVEPVALAAFRALTREMVEAARSEPGALIYERFLSASGSAVHIYERYVDSDAGIAHLRSFEDLFAARFLPLVTRTHVCLYGEASPELLALFAALGARPFRYLDGFAR